MLIVDICPLLLMQTVKRTLQTALVWTIYEELQPAMKAAFQGATSQKTS